MPILDRDPFRLLSLDRSAGPEEIQKAYEARRTAEGEHSVPDSHDRSALLLLNPEGLRLARMATPVADRSFEELTASLPPRPRYLGPGAWKKALRHILAEEEPRRR